MKNWLRCRLIKNARYKAGQESCQRKLAALAGNVERIEFPARLTKEPAEKVEVADQMVASLARTIEDGD